MIWTFHPIKRFADFAPAWDTVNTACGASPLLSTAFVLPLVEEFSNGSELLAICSQVDAAAPLVEVEARVIAMAILTRKNGLVWETFQPSQAPLGACIYRRDIDWAECVGKLIRSLPGWVAVLGITQQDPELIVRQQGQRTLEASDYIRTARISINGTFEQYWKNRGKNLRQNLRKQRQKLERDNIVTRLEIIVAADEVQGAIDDYAGLESAGWKAAKGTAIGKDNDQGRFYAKMLTQFCSLDKGKIYRYWYNDRLVAMDLCIEDGDTLVILKTTYDEQVDNATSPALLMRQDALMQIFAEGSVGKVEFYGRVMEWHTRWTEEIRTMYHLTAYRWPILLTLRGLLGKAAP
jgi:hypothetical protein